MGGDCVKRDLRDQGGIAVAAVAALAPTPSAVLRRALPISSGWRLGGLTGGVGARRGTHRNTTTTSTLSWTGCLTTGECAEWKTLCLIDVFHGENAHLWKIFCPLSNAHGMQPNSPAARIKPLEALNHPFFRDSSNSSSSSKAKAQGSSDERSS